MINKHVLSIKTFVALVGVVTNKQPMPEVILSIKTFHVMREKVKFALVIFVE